MSAATLVFADVVGFSKKPTAQQKQLVEALTAEVIHELRPYLVPPLVNPEIVALPTGDGMALAFVHSATRHWDRNTLLGLIVHLHRWSSGLGGSIGRAQLRIGVHVGAVELVSDINGKVNVCGDTINIAQRVMDAADPSQTLFSDSAFREYIGIESPQGVLCSRLHEGESLEFQGPIEVYAKHGLQLLVFKAVLSVNGSLELDWWSNQGPASARMLLVTLTPLPKEIVGPFSSRLENATDIALVQLTGDRLLDKYEKGLIKFSSELKRLWIFMPDPIRYRALGLSVPHAKSELLEECIPRWHTLLLQLKEQHPDADLKLGLFREPPFYGASYLNWERPGGRIHVSAYIWGVAAHKCPGYDLDWLGKSPSEVYEVYVAGLRSLNAKTGNSLLTENNDQSREDTSALSK